MAGHPGTLFGRVASVAFLATASLCLAPATGALARPLSEGDPAPDLLGRGTDGRFVEVSAY